MQAREFCTELSPCFAEATVVWWLPGAGRGGGPADGRGASFGGDANAQPSAVAAAARFPGSPENHWPGRSKWVLPAVYEPHPFELFLFFHINLFIYFWLRWVSVAARGLLTAVESSCSTCSSWTLGQTGIASVPREAALFSIRSEIPA